MDRFIPIVVSVVLFCLAAPWAGAQTEDKVAPFDDSPLQRDVDYPDWFKPSFLNLREDLRDAVQAGKQGLIVYFGQQRCPYCLKLLQDNFGMADIAAYTQRHFDVVPIDIWSEQGVIDLAGASLSEKALALREDTQFTPALIFYDSNGEAVMRLRGYYSPYHFRAALEYVADQHYLIQSFREYLERGGYLAYELDELISEPFFSPPPYLLSRTGNPAERPLVVFFEQGNCHACDVLHGETLDDPRVRELLAGFEAVQLHLWQDTPVLTPGGERLSARAWGEKLGLFYTPTLIFFDPNGREIIRLDSVIQFHRLHGVLRYVLEQGYLQEPNYLLWRARVREGS